MRHEPRALEWESHGKLVIVAFTNERSRFAGFLSGALIFLSKFSLSSNLWVFFFHFSTLYHFSDIRVTHSDC